MVKQGKANTMTGNPNPGAVGVAWMVITCDPTKPSYYGNPVAPTVSSVMVKKAK